MAEEPETTSPNSGPVLELRVHGVNNTSPSSMLDLGADAVEEVLGDDLAGFWRPKREALDHVAEGDRGWVPPEFTREAYSWGGLARSSPGGSGTGRLNTVVAALGRVGWAVLLPFGLVNVAYWARHLGDEVVAPGGPAGEPDRPLRRTLRTMRGPAHGAGASSVRLFGLGLTVFAVVTVCELSMDLVGTQCFRGGTAVCGKLPGWLDWLAPRPQAVRLALTSLLPLLALVGLWVLSAVSRSRYERAVSDEPAADAGRAEPAAPDRASLLATPGFWRGDRMVEGLAQLHLAAGVAVVALALAWPATFGTGEACQTPRSLVGGACWTQVGEQPTLARVLFPVCIIAALLVLSWVAVVTWRRASDVPDVARRAGQPAKALSSAVVLIAGAAVLVATEISLVVVRPALSEQIPLLGVSALPSVVAAIVLALAAGGFTARLNRTGPVWAVALLVSLLMVGISRWWAIAVAVVVGALTLHVRSAGGGLSGVRRWTAWGGTGPGMFLGAALMLAAMLSAFLLLGAGDWLNGANSASSLIDGRAASGAVTSPGTDACGAPCPPPDPVLRVPMPYVLFGTATLAAVLLFGLVVVVMLWRTRNPDIPAAPTTPADAAATTPAVTRSRRFAAIAHRAEKLVALLVLIDLAMLLFALIFAVSGSAPWDKAWGGSPFLRRLTDLATAGVALLAVGVLAAAVGGGVTGNKRPLGLVWDLVCFLPRAAHPFGPPCYAERAVPELSARVSWWLAQPDRMVDDQRRGGRAVVLSAHSLGGVLAVAVLLGRSLRAADARPAVRFLTYGCQLRAYVSRVFPELLGPAVLGTPPVRAARFWTKDPWSGEIAEGTRPADETLSMSVVRQLTPPTGGVLWRNLWRRTDYLGFPVWSYEPNDIDAGAEELDHTAYLAEVVSHSNYPRSQAYRTALDELAEQA